MLHFQTVEPLLPSVDQSHFPATVLVFSSKAFQRDVVVDTLAQVLRLSLVSRKREENRDVLATEDRAVMAVEAGTMTDLAKVDKATETEEAQEAGSGGGSARQSLFANIQARARHQMRVRKASEYRSSSEEADSRHRVDKASKRAVELVTSVPETPSPPLSPRRKKVPFVFNASNWKWSSEDNTCSESDTQSESILARRRGPCKAEVNHGEGRSRDESIDSVRDKVVAKEEKAPEKRDGNGVDKSKWINTSGPGWINAKANKVQRKIDDFGDGLYKPGPKMTWSAKEKAYGKDLTGPKPPFKTTDKTVRKKCEKKLWSGGSCVDCEVFVRNLYPGDGVAQQTWLDKFSKHRGGMYGNRYEDTPDNLYGFNMSEPEEKPPDKDRTPSPKRKRRRVPFGKEVAKAEKS